MLILALTTALVLFAQDTPPVAGQTPADAIAAKVTGEPDPCARRELIVSRYAAELAGRFEDPTPEDLAEFRRMASEMYQASHDMSRPRGAPMIDFDTACSAAQSLAPARQTKDAE